jgi:MFS family permease
VVILIGLDDGLQAFATLALSFFYKDELHVGPALVSLAAGLLLVPWAVKPIWGIISDSFPIAGSRRKAYLFLASAVSAVCWFLLASKAVVHSFWAAVGLLLLKSIAFAFLSVIAKGLLVERSSRRNQRFASFLQTLFFGVQSFAGMLAAYFGGFLLDYISPRTVFALSAIFPLLVCAVTVFLPEEPFTPVRLLPI